MICHECGTEFEPKIHNQLYCSKGCKRRISNRNGQRHYAIGLRRPKAVEITDLLSEVTYTISKVEYERYKQAYSELGGFLVRML